MHLDILIAIIIVLIGGSVELYTHYHEHGILPFKSIARFDIGSLAFWALGDRVLIQEDEFRSGYECPGCGGSGRVICDNCGGAGERSIATDNGPTVAKKCSHCEGGTITCPECKGKGGLLVIADVQQRRPTSGIVVSAGRKCRYLKPGDSVLYSNFAGYVVDLARADKPVCMRILHETEVLAGMTGHFTLTNLKQKSELTSYAP